MKDKKTILIILLTSVIIILISVMGWNAFTAGIASAREQVYLKGTQDGRLLEQRDVLTSVIRQGYYTIPIVDENNQTQQVVLGILQQDPNAKLS
ncbi:MAG: hypothetical protein O2779_02060 [Nanoarchaeota archaeon]|nr:hypothetical protein [Nanoarchaeota archaeon]